MEKMEELVKNEVKRTFNPEFLNRLDEVIIFHALSDADLIQILELLVQQLNANLVQKAITHQRDTKMPRSGFWKRRWSTAPTGRVRCAAHCSATSRTRCRRH